MVGGGEKNGEVSEVFKEVSRLLSPETESISCDELVGKKKRKKNEEEEEEEGGGEEKKLKEEQKNGEI